MDLFDIFVKFPELIPAAFAAFGGILMLIVLWLLVVPGSKELKQTAKELKEFEKEANSTELSYIETLNHIILSYDDLFIQMKNMKEFYRLRFQLDDPGRTLLNRELMYHKLNFWQPILEKLASNADGCFAICHSSKINQCDKMQKMFTDAFVEGLNYINFMDNPELVSLDGIPYADEDRTIMKSYMTEFVTGLHHSKEVIVEEWIKSIWASKQAPNCLVKASESLRVYNIAFSMAKIDSETLADSFGEELTGKYFLGVEIGPVK